MDFKVITPVLNAVLVVACVIHIGINAYYELFPDIPSVKEYETYLGNIDFPVSFKICLGIIQVLRDQGWGRGG